IRDFHVTGFRRVLFRSNKIVDVIIFVYCFLFVCLLYLLIGLLASPFASHQSTVNYQLLTSLLRPGGATRYFCWPRLRLWLSPYEIGRASCRVSVYISNC